jgi:hypothetical protein
MTHMVDVGRLDADSLRPTRLAREIAERFLPRA